MKELVENVQDASSLKLLLNQLIGGYWVSQAVFVAAELGIADLLIEGPRTAEELSRIAGANGVALHRLLRALASVGIFSQDEKGRFALTPIAQRLRSDVADSQRSFAIMSGAEFYAAWGKLLVSVRTGERGFDHAFGAPFFQYMTEHPERHGIYDAAMNGIHGGETEPMLAAYDFSSFETVVDIGGGGGQMLRALLGRHPSVRGVLFDLPAVADRARPGLRESPLADRCEVVGGDFFSSVPAGADAYLMRHVIHDWDDADAVRILRKCREAMAPHGRVLVVESVIHPGNEPCFGKWLDLMMLLVGGRERTEEEYRRLFSEARLRLSRVVPTVAEVSILEGVPAE